MGTRCKAGEIRCKVDIAGTAQLEAVGTYELLFATSINHISFISDDYLTMELHGCTGLIVS